MSNQTLDAPPMARAKRDDRPVKIDAQILHDAQVVAAAKGISAAEYLSELLRQPVARDLVRFAKDTLKANKDPAD